MCLIGGCSKKKDPAPVICYITSFTEVIGTNNYSETLVYDDENRVIIITATFSGSPPEIYTFTYGSDGNLASANFGGNENATYTFDGQNRLILRTFSPSGATTSYAYNASGQNTQRVNTDPNCASCAYTLTYTYPNTTTHNYSERYYEGADGTTYTIAYEYDDHPNPYKLVLYSSTGTTNNVTKQTFTDNSASSTTTFTYTYNDRGYPLTAISDSGNTRTYAYDCK